MRLHPQKKVNVKIDKEDNFCHILMLLTYIYMDIVRSHAFLLKHFKCCGLMVHLVLSFVCLHYTLKPVSSVSGADSVRPH